MAITPINNAMIQRTVDVNLMKHQEDVKPVVDQQNIQIKVDQREDMLNHQVIEPGNSNKTKNDADAKDEGRGQLYAGKPSRKRSREKESSPQSDRVIKKQNSNSFDMKI
ncbi:MAG: hypothetical protein NC180_08820 [Muribaculaceae bacterium]|nr:hypothetical protein [Muribaculaceae bacterium]